MGALRRLDRAAADLAAAIRRGDREAAVAIRGRFQSEARTLTTVAAELTTRS
jgi:hypothetical protein